MHTHKHTVFSSSFLAMCLANLLMFIAFYLIMPVLPMYLALELQAEPVIMGSILAAYTLCALFVRPFAGFFADIYKGKAFFLLTYAAFALCFAGYLLPASLVLLFILRAVHGASFSMVTTATTVYVVAITPPARLGSGIGFFGATAALAMSLGPMLGVFILEEYSYNGVFLCSIGIVCLGFVAGLWAKPLAPADKAPRIPMSVKTLFLPIVKPAFIGFACTAFIYGLLLTYISLLVIEKGFAINVGYVFFLLAVGLIISRLFAGRLIDGGGLLRLIIAGKLVVIVACLVFTFAQNTLSFFVAALFIGLGYGLLMPAYQTLFTTLARPHERGRANSLFFSAFDLGIGLAVFTGGVVADYASLQAAYLIGCLFLVVSLVYFILRVGPHYEAHKLV